jgi:hypothetical protein
MFLMPRLKPFIGAATVAAVCGVAAVASSGSTPKPASRAPDWSARNHFAVFRRTVKATDWPRSNGANASLARAFQARLVHSSGPESLYAVDRGNGEICLTFQAADDGFTTSTCGSAAQAANPGSPIELTVLDSVGSHAYLLLPDGVQQVQATDINGRRSVIDATANAVALPVDAETATWTSLDGRDHTYSSLRPATPPDVARAVARERARPKP